MRKAIINTLVATTMLTSAVANAVTWNSDYGVITDLTPNHIEFLDNHVSANSGVLAGFAWTRLNDGSYVSMKVSEIRDAGSMQAAKTVFIEKVKEVIIERTIETIKEVMVVTEDVTEIKRLQGIIRDLEARTLVFGDMPTISINSDVTASVSASEYIHETGDYITQSYVNGWGQTRTYHYVLNADGSVNGNRLQVAPTGRNVGTTDRSGNLAYLSEYNAVISNDVSATFFSNNDITINNHTFSLSASFTMADITNVIEDAYNAGFNDGYTQGFNDGFVAGVASVSISQ